jgi:hypothetical protein
MRQGGGGGGGLSSVTTDGVTLQGLGTVASPVAIKAVQVDGVTVMGSGTVASTAQIKAVQVDGVTLQGAGTVASPLGVLAISTDAVTLQGNGTVASKVAIKAVQVDGTSITGAGTVASPLVATLQRPAGGSGCSIATVTAQTFTTATPTAVSFTGQTATHDDGPYWSNSNPTRFTCLVQGWHIFSGYLQWTVNNTGMRDTRIRVNATTTLMINTIADTVALAAPGIMACIAVYLNVNDYVELLVNQTSGGNLNSVQAAASFVRLF